MNVKATGRRRWTHFEDDRLKELAAMGASVSKIAGELGRSETVVKNRAALLSIPLGLGRSRQRPPHIPTHQERIGIQAIRAGRPIPPGVGRRTILGMLAKGWIEREPGGEYRITEAGIDATKLKIPIGKDD